MTEYTLEEPYISIYDRPKGRKKKYNTPKELAQAKRDTASKLYYDNYEYKRLQIKLYKERVKGKKTKWLIIFFLTSQKKIILF